MRISTCFGVVAAVIVPLMMPPSASAATCESLLTLALPNVTITEAAVVAAGQFSPRGPGREVPLPAQKLPSFCRVSATLTPTRDSQIKVEVWMLTTGWNGKFLGVGNGGWAGSIPYGQMISGLGLGYAVGSTDTGHSGADATFAPGHPEKLIDFGYRAVHEMTATAKAVVKAFYSDAPRFSYWSGCSTGGRQGLVEAQRFPGDYDGIVAGAAANNWTRLVTGLMWGALATLKDPASHLSTEKLAVLNRAVLNVCDAQDGVSDGVIENPRSCRFDPQVVACTAGDAADCLTQPQVDAAKRIYAPASNPRTGEALFPGLPPGSEPGWRNAAGALPAFPIADSHFKNVVFEDANWNFATFDFDRDVARADRVDNGTFSASPDLNAFAKRGGKLLMYHGWSDPEITVQLGDVLRGREGQVGSDADRFCRPTVHGTRSGTLRRRSRPEPGVVARGARTVGRTRRRTEPHRGVTHN